MAEVLSVTNPHEATTTTNTTATTYLTQPPSHPRDASRPNFALNSTDYAVKKTGSYSDSDLELASESSSSPSSSPLVDKGSINSTPPSSISLDQEEEEDEDEPFFPSYGDRAPAPSRETCDLPSSPAPTEDDMTSTTPSTPDQDPYPAPLLFKPADDTAVHEEPSRQVDYLTHDWLEEDIWQSWRHIVSNRKLFGERSRLENASWRTWTKSKYSLETVSPARLNWSKDCDVTWLYGPLQEGRPHGCTQSKAVCSHSEPASNLSKNNSFLKKPILKKRSVSEVMLQKSLSSSSLVKQAAAAVQAQRSSSRGAVQHRPDLTRSLSDGAGLVSASRSTAGPTSMITSQSVSGLQSPEGNRRHIRFDDTVEQCIAVDFKEGEHNPTRTRDAEVSSSEDELIMMRSRFRRPSSGQSSQRDSFVLESKGIAMLPSTTLKYHHDEPHCAGHSDQAMTAAHHGPRLQHSSSQDTLRPARPDVSSGFDSDDEEDSWQPSGAFDTPRPGSAAGLGDAASEAPAGLRRTASGMFMPFDDDEEPSYASTGVLGRVVDTVNTARDIFSVIVNVGWRS